jgi:hypothetical protein
MAGHCRSNQAAGQNKPLKLEATGASVMTYMKYEYHGGQGRPIVVKAWKSTDTNQVANSSWYFLMTQYLPHAFHSHLW